MNPRIEALWADLTADRKKAGVLGVLLLVGGIVGIRALAQSAGGPRTASAQPAAAPASSAAAPPPGGAMLRVTGPESVAGARQIDLTPPPSSASRGRPSRDVFVLSDAHFPEPEPEANPAEKPKSGASAADTTVDEGEVARRRALADAGRLRVRSITVGPKTLAILDFADADAGPRRSQVVRAGDVIRGFTVTQVSALGVVVERDGVTATLRPAPHPTKP